MTDYEYAEDVYNRIRYHQDKADRVASIQSFLANEYGKGVRAERERIRKNIEDAKGLVDDAFMKLLLERVLDE